MTAEQHIVTAELAGKTLAAALRQWHPEKSWSKVRQLVESRRVRVSASLCFDPARRVHEGEIVEVLSSPASPAPAQEDIVIRWFDRHLVVVEKPPGMASIRRVEELNWPAARKALQPTLDEQLPEILSRRIKELRNSGRRPTIHVVHRLDRETSGLLVFARTELAFEGLAEQFKRHTVHRRYLAIVVGHPTARTVESWLVPDRGDGKRGSTNLPNVGKRAVTHVRPIELFANASLVECRLETGRTHQIRIHLSELSHPVIGDKRYRGPVFTPPIDDPVEAPRLCLHAAELGFDHPITGEPCRFQMDLPADMKRVLDRLARND